MFVHRSSRAESISTQLVTAGLVTTLDEANEQELAVGFGLVSSK